MVEIESRAMLEVAELHRFLEAWFNGSIEKSDDAFSRLSDAWPISLRLVAPSGDVRSSAELLDQTYSEYGAYPTLRIEVKAPSAQVLIEGVAAVVYEEWHHDYRESEGRLCSAIISFDSSAAKPARWVHIHESPIVQGGSVKYS
jgi:hypothetical protein